MSTSLVQRCVQRMGAKAFYDSLSEEERRALPFNWEAWARPEQLPPEGKWRFWLVQAGRGYGKALALDTPIPTPGGWTTMGALRVGDVVFDEQGHVCRVTFATGVQLGRPCNSVVFSDGTTIVADDEHRWVTWCKAARKAHGRAKSPTIHPMVRTTSEIRATLRVQDGREVNHSVPLAAPLQLPDAMLPVPPYTLGVWLGDGDSRGAMLTCADADRELLQLLAADGTVCEERLSGRRGGVGRYIMGSAPRVRDLANGRMLPNGSLQSKLVALGLRNAKRIPAVYLRGSVAQRRALLAGLMDTDGCVAPGGNVEFCSTKASLAEGVFELAVSLGFKPTLLVGRAFLRGRDVGPKYRVTWTPHVPVFRLSRKLARQHSGKSQACRNLHRYIVDVRPIESVPVRCITVDSPSHLFLAGRAMVPTHNTRQGAEFARRKAREMPGSRGALVAQTPAQGRDVMVLGESGLLACCPESERPEYKRTERLLTWPLVPGRGQPTVAHIYSAHAFEELRGPQHHWAWLDEAAKWKHPTEAFDQMNLGLRLGEHPQACITTTPRPVALIRKLRKDPRCVVTRGSTYDNQANLAADYLADIRAKYEHTRMGRQELEGELLEDVVGALWKRGPMIDAHRVPTYPTAIGANGKVMVDASGRPIPKLDAIVVGVDPSVADNEDEDEEEGGTDLCGIVVAGRAGRGINSQYYTLEDASIFGSPDEWARAVVSAYQRWAANKVVAEVNNGGALVGIAIKQVSPLVKYEAVHAAQGKRTRAEPVSMLYEQGRVHHAGVFEELEDQMCTWVPGVSRKSPDRMDALVWAISALSQVEDASARTRLLLGA